MVPFLIFAAGSLVVVFSTPLRLEGPLVDLTFFRTFVFDMIISHHSQTGQQIEDYVRNARMLISRND